jgi:hypothetical protein
MANEAELGDITMHKEATQLFDATIDLTLSMVPDHLTPREAVSLVRRAVAAMPGASWVSVDYAGDVSASVPWLTLYQPDTASLLNEAVASPLFGFVKSVVEGALS